MSIAISEHAPGKTSKNPARKQLFTTRIVGPEADSDSTLTSEFPAFRTVPPKEALFSVNLGVACSLTVSVTASQEDIHEIATSGSRTHVPWLSYP